MQVRNYICFLIIIIVKQKKWTLKQAVTLESGWEFYDKDFENAGEGEWFQLLGLVSGGGRAGSYSRTEYLTRRRKFKEI